MEKTRTREYFLDYSKAFILLFMIMTHMVEKWPTESIQNHPFFYLLYTRGLLFGATAFMLSMGWTMNYSRNSTPQLMFKRGLNLLFTGYLLNVLRNIAFIFSGDINELTRRFLCPDILPFAGLVFIVFSLTIKLGLKHWVYPVAALALTAIGFYLAPYLPFTEHVDVENRTIGLIVTKSLLGTIYYTRDVYSFFPLLNWLVFPAVGFWVSSLYLKAKSQNKGMLFMKRACIVSFLIFAAVFVLDHFWENVVPGLVNYETFHQLGHNNTVDFIYEVTPMHAILASSFIVGTFCAVNLIISAIKKHWPETNTLDRWTLWFSRNINNVYIIQWILICNISFFLAKSSLQFDMPTFMVSYLVMLAATIIITIAYTRFKQRFGKANK